MTAAVSRAATSIVAGAVLTCLGAVAFADESQSTAVRNASGRATEAEESPTARANHRVFEYGRNGLDISLVNDRSGEPGKRWENRVRLQWDVSF